MKIHHKDENSSQRGKFITNMKIHHENEIHYEDVNSSQRWKFITKMKIHHRVENSSLKLEFVTKMKNSSFGWKFITDIEICPLDDKTHQWIDIYLSDENSWLECKIYS